MTVSLRSLRTMLFAACAVCACLSTPVQARDFRSADVHPADYPTVEAVKHMGKLLAEQTKGRLGVRVFPTALSATSATRSSS